MVFKDSNEASPQTDQRTPPDLVASPSSSCGGGSLRWNGFRCAELPPKFSPSNSWAGRVSFLLP